MVLVYLDPILGLRWSALQPMSCHPSFRDYETGRAKWVTLKTLGVLSLTEATKYSDNMPLNRFSLMEKMYIASVSYVPAFTL